MVGGRAYWSTQQLATSFTSLFLLVWGLVWVLHVSSYGVCTRQVHELEVQARRAESLLVHGTLQAADDMHTLSDATADLSAAAAKTAALWQRGRIPLVASCRSEHLDRVPWTTFAVHAVTDETYRAECEEKQAKLGLYKVEVLAEAAEAEAEALYVAAAHVAAQYSYPMGHIGVMEKDVVATRDGFEFLYAVAEQKLLEEFADGKWSADATGVQYASPGWLAGSGDPLPPPRRVSEGAAKPLPAAEQAAVRTRLTPTRLHLFHQSAAGAVAAAAADKAALTALQPLVPRAAETETDLPASPAFIPVHFSAVDLTYARTTRAYTAHLREMATQGGYPNPSAVTGLSLHVLEHELDIVYESGASAA